MKKFLIALAILFFTPVIFPCVFGLMLGSDDYGRREQSVLHVLAIIQTIFVWFLIYKVFM